MSMHTAEGDTEGNHTAYRGQPHSQGGYRRACTQPRGIQTSMHTAKGDTDEHAHSLGGIQRATTQPRGT